jgi:hypothetical protein
MPSARNVAFFVISLVAFQSRNAFRKHERMQGVSKLDHESGPRDMVVSNQSGRGIGDKKV